MFPSRDFDVKLEGVVGFLFGLKIPGIVISLFCSTCRFEKRSISPSLSKSAFPTMLYPSGIDKSASPAVNVL